MISDSKILQLLTAPTVPFSGNFEAETKAEDKEEETVLDTKENLAEVNSKTSDTINTNIISKIFTDEATEKLSSLSTKRLLGMTLKEALAEITAPKVDEPWVKTLSDSNSQLAKGTFSFSDYSESVNFLSSVLSQAKHTESELTKLNLSNEEGKWSVSVDLESDTLSLSENQLQLIQYCNYKFKSSNSKVIPEETYSEALSTEEVDPFSYKGSLSAIPIQVLSEGNRKVLKVPVAVLGDWVHPKYGDLKFAQKDFDEMKANVQTKVIGYEPPLFLGHIETQPGGPEYPAEGFLEKLTQEGEVLYGEFGVVNDNTYSSVSKGQFRYSSGEFVRNHKDKKTGKPIGTTLVGVALTNRPFLTGMPRVTTLSENSTDCISTILLTDTTDTMSNTQEPLEVSYEQKLTEFKSELMLEFNKVKEGYAEDVNSLKQKLSETEAKVTEAEQKLSEVTADRDKFANRVKEVEAQKRQDAIEVKLSELQALAIPKEQKEKYSELIKSGALGENEDVVLASLKEISTSLSDAVTTQHGEETATHGQNDESVSDPYQDTIKRNQKLAEAREALLLQKLA
jgi:hypothetical protein